MDIQASAGMAQIMLFASFALSMGVMCYFMCKPESMRQVPLNYILLTVFTLAEAVLVGFISSTYTQESVLLVLAITCIVVFSLTLFACQTSIDFTGMGSYLFANMLGFGGSPAMQGLRLLYAAAGALIFSLYL